MEDNKWVSMDLDDLDSKRIDTQGGVNFNPFEVEMTIDPNENHVGGSEMFDQPVDYSYTTLPRRLTSGKNAW